MKLKKHKRELKDCEARQSLMGGFVVNGKFREYSVDNLCATGLRVALNENNEEWGRWQLVNLKPEFGEYYLKTNPQITPVKYASLVLRNLTGQAQISAD